MVKISKEAALEYHESGRPGKIEVKPTKAYRTQTDLSLAYSPGVAYPCLEIQQNPDDDTVKFACQQMLNHDSFKTTLNYCGLTQDAMDTYRAGLEGVII